MSNRDWENNWKFEGKGDAGGQGETKKVSSIADPAKIAMLKLLKNQKKQQARDRMYREVVNLEILSKLGASVPKVFEHNADQYGDLSYKLYVAMEFIPGLTLESYVTMHGPMSFEDAASVVTKLAETMKIAHTFPILHRDLKPANVILRNDNPADPVTIDYGLSFNIDDADVTETSESFRNEFLDLPEFRTPGANKRDARSDVTMLVAIVGFCLSGSAPGPLLGPDGSLPHQRAGAAMEKLLAAGALGRSLAVFFAKGFNQNVENRFRSVEEFEDRLRHVAAQRSNTDDEDPRDAIAVETARLRAGDRKTQITAFHAGARPGVQRILDLVSGYKIDPPFTFQRVSLNEPLGLPPEFETLNLSFAVGVKYTNHSNERKVAFETAAHHGKQCAVLYRLYRVGPNGGNEAPLGPWEVLCWFEGGDQPDFQILERWLMRWLSDSVHEIAREILP